MRSTTVIAVRRNGRLAMAGDGQVSMGETIVKASASKVRRLFGGKVLAGFAGSTADALTLLDRFEGKLSEHGGSLLRAAMALAREWRTDRALRRLEALLLVGDLKDMLLLSGGGDVIAPDGEAMAIGSGGPYALAAARAFLISTDWEADRIAVESLRIAASLCVYTNDQITLEVIEP